MGYPNVIQQINSKLPLSGGTITGTLYFTDRGIITGNHSSSPNKSLEIYADTDGWGGNGSGIAMRSKDAEATDRGMVTIRAGDGTNTSNIRLTPNGNFTYNGNEVVVVDGNTIKGSIRFDTGVLSSVASQNEIILFANSIGSIGSDYSCLAMRNELHTNPGSFYIRSRNNSNDVQSIMILQPDGTFTWNYNPIVVLTESYNSGATFYRKYSDGWIEQGGKFVGATPASSINTVSFYKPFSNTNYKVIVQPMSNDTSNNTLVVQYGSSYYGVVVSKSTSSFQGRGSASTDWYACGY